MSLIQITPDEVKKSSPWDTSWYKMKIIDAVTTQSKDKQSFNHTVTYEVVELQGNQNPDYLGRTIGYVGGTSFNSKAMGKVIPLLASLEGINQLEFIEKYKDKGIEFELDKLKTKLVQVKIEMADNNQGGMAPKATGWLPYSDVVPF
jgi:hypothetical protein